MALFTDGTYAILSGTAGGWLKRNQTFLRAQKYISGTIYIGLGLVTAPAAVTSQANRRKARDAAARSGSPGSL